MTEAEWLACDDPQKMLECLKGKASDRKFRLFAAACALRVIHLAQDEWNIFALEAAERAADGRFPVEALDDICREGEGGCRPGTSRVYLAADPDACQAARNMSGEVAYRLAAAGPSRADGGRLVEIQAGLTALVRDIFGNPFRPLTVHPACLTPAVKQLAQATYDERLGGEVDPDRLAILADALEEVGCPDPAILSHLRGPGPHVRGCWVVDLLLGKE
ncbi:MAG: hypothetical protein L0Z62_23735 [Gemmataceae bacterium]|nr:hypothetical protein [Gemmataceae bacterium]